MHSFTDLIDRGTALILRSLNTTQDEIHQHFKTSSSNTLVKQVQMIQLQKAITAVGMFAMFEPILKAALNCKEEGFVGAKRFLKDQGEKELARKFGLYVLAVNVLKHGHGRSYEVLLSEKEPLPFRIKLPDEYFFNEGDVSEIHTLIEVNDAFVLDCRAVITDVSFAIREAMPGANI